MGYLLRCPTCGNDTEGNIVVKCGECGHISCDRCKKNEGFMDNSACPVCGNSWRYGVPNVILGEIKPINRN